MSERGSPLIWTEPEWRSRAEAWVAFELKRAGLAITGIIDQPHIRPWATVLRVPTDGSLFYFKAGLSGFGHETALAQALCRWRPDCMVEILAIDAERGWMLMRDAGGSLRALVRSSGDLSHLKAVLTLYAEVQIELSNKLPELLELTVDRRLSVFPSEYERLLADQDAMLLGHKDGLTPDQYEYLQSLRSRVAEICECLTAYKIPETLQHDDFHDANVFVLEGRYHLADWGDSCVSHPFCSLVVGLRSPAHTYNLDPNGSEIRELRDAYLRPWTQFGPYERLLEVVELALPLGMISRALTWHRTLTNLDEPWRSQYADSVPGWLKEFLSNQIGGPVR